MYMYVLYAWACAVVEACAEELYMCAYIHKCVCIRMRLRLCIYMRCGQSMHGGTIYMCVCNEHIYVCVYVYVCVEIHHLHEIGVA